MAYVSKEHIAAVRKEIRKQFPSKDGWKISVVNDNYSSIYISILEAPFNMLTNEQGHDSEDVNIYYIEKHYKDTPEICNVLQKINSIANNGNWDKSDIMTDYFNVGWYVTLTIGRWDKPFKVSEKKLTKTSKQKTMQEIMRCSKQEPIPGSAS